MTWRGMRFNWTALTLVLAVTLAIALLLLLPRVMHSAVTVVIPMGPQVTCELNTGMVAAAPSTHWTNTPGDTNPPESVSDRCLRWAQDLLGNGRLRFPPALMARPSPA